jgi:REP element-mobilizing transposase RayT
MPRPRHFYGENHYPHYWVRNRRGHDMNIWSEEKHIEKINYMHNNPVKRGLVAQRGDWPWSSWRFYDLEDQVHPGD